jgi:hypothetical protein
VIQSFIGLPFVPDPARQAEMLLTRVSVAMNVCPMADPKIPERVPNAANDVSTPIVDDEQFGAPA